jgi:hypothetical protein
MKQTFLILGAAFLTVLAGCAVPAKPNLEQQRRFERELGDAARARYWAIQARQQPSSSKP